MMAEKKLVAILDDDTANARGIQALLELADLEGVIFTDVARFVRVVIMADGEQPLKDRLYGGCILDYWLFYPDGRPQGINGEGVAKLLRIKRSDLVVCSVTSDAPEEHFKEVGLVQERFPKAIILGNPPRVFRAFLNFVGRMGGSPDKITEIIEAPAVQPVVVYAT
ncbi:MAG: hypothetical protein HYT38_02320 [Candidatus Sungbacteria bacterium]|uniref:Uncharacterized protein n=1 Tax=Candidatus Sungiibacteriota bacterium TaxID=2750080 RepID=A0A9D6HQQ4_9BACT|nr:hypothetical protein [Candidatus Sungbacteria bacterium]